MPTNVESVAKYLMTTWWSYIHNLDVLIYDILKVCEMILNGLSTFHVSGTMHVNILRH